MSDIQEEQKRLYKRAEENDKENLQYMSIEEALYQLKQNIKMHAIEGTTSNQNEREKVILNYINKLQEVNNRLNNIIDEFNRNYIEIIKRCDEMIKKKYYSNAMVVDKYANEIKNIVKYYVPDAEWIELKGDNN